MLGDLLGSTDGKVLGSYEGIKLGLSGGKVLGTILGNVYVIILGMDVGTELVSLDGLFDGSNDGKLERLFLGDSLEYTDGKLIGSDEGIKLVSADDKVLGIILGNVDGIILGIDDRTDLRSLDESFDGYNDGLFESCSCYLLSRLSCHWCQSYLRGRHDIRHCCRSSGLNMVGSTCRGRGVDVRRCWVACNK